MRASRFIISGILTIVPLWVTWIVFEFILRQLAAIGQPIGDLIRLRISDGFPQLAQWVSHPWLDEVIAVIATLTGLYLLGWFATRVIGRQLIALLEGLLARVPFVQKVYGAVKKLISVMEQKPEGTQRVVLIEFPSREMKTVGLVTRVIVEQATGRKLAIVYVPTTPNPTSGYMEIVPIERVVETDWTLDEAMNFIISAGAVAPERMYYSSRAELAEMNLPLEPGQVEQTETS